MASFSWSWSSEEPDWEAVLCTDVLIDVTVHSPPLPLNPQLSAWSLLNLSLFNDLKLLLTLEGLICCLEPPQQSCLSAGKQMHLHRLVKLQT